MIFIDELKNFRIYRKQFFLPYNDKDKKHGSLVYLLTPNYISSKNLMNYPLSINRKYFESYYFERNAAYYINTGRVNKDELLDEAVQEQLDSAYHNNFDYEGFDEYMLVSKGAEVSSENNTYYDSIMAAVVANKLNNGEYDVYVHPIDHPEDPTYIGTIAVQVIQHSYYDAFYKWIAWEEIEDEGDYLEEAKREDALHNADKFKSGDINLCFITGLSGSGKSTMAKGLDAEHYELDDLLVQWNFSDENLKEYGDLIYSFFKGPGKKYREVASEEGQTDKYEEGIVRDFIKYAKSYAASHKNKKFIIEGVELIWFIQPSELKDYAVFVKGTSANTSMHRSAWRDSSDASNRVERIGAYAKTMLNKDRKAAYKERDKDVQKWIDYYSNKSINEATDNKSSKVYFSKNITGEEVLKLYQALGINLEGNIAVKLHSGEPGNQNYIQPEFWKDIIDYVDGTVVECNTAYNGERNTTEKHLKVISDHGWDKYFKFDLMDAEGPDLELPIENGHVLTKNIVGKNLANYNSMLVLSHFKGHPMGGYGGALKNISIGIASSAGKKEIHRVPQDKMVGEYNDFMQEDFLASMADAASSIVKYFNGNMVFINVMKNLSIDCDCVADAHDPCMKDIGILISTDPVALDQACLDLIYSSDDPGKDELIERIESKQGKLTPQYAEELGIGTRNYDLIDIDSFGEISESVSSDEEYLSAYEKFQKGLLQANVVLNESENQFNYLTETQIACREMQEEFVTENAVLLEQLEDALLEISQSDINKNMKLEPVFIVTTYTGTPFGKLVRKITKDPYSHVLISFDPSLREMYSFDFRNKVFTGEEWIEADGFVIDSIERYRSMPTNNMQVICMMVTSKTKKALQKTVDFYRENMNKTKYGILNLFDFLRGSKKLSSFKDLTMFCSEFVDSLLKSINIDISGKSSRNTAPSDLGRYTEKNNFFKVFEGRANEYNQEEIERELEEFRLTIPHKELNAIQKKIPFSEAEDLASKLKYIVRNIKMKNKRGIYKFNANRRKAEYELPTASSIQSSISVPTPTVGAHESYTEDEMLMMINNMKAALKYEDARHYYMNEDIITILDEADSKYDAPLRKIIWNDRIRSNKEVIKLYNNVKNDIPWIKYTFVQPGRYQNRNLFYDLSFYNEVFFRNNTFKLDKAVNLYYDLLLRLLDPTRIPSGYTKKTIFIPVLDWVNDPRTRTWLYRDTINPISVLYRVMNAGTSKAKQLFGNNDIVFFGNNCYFKINFSELTHEQEKNCAQMFRSFIIKMEKGQQFSPDEEDQTPNDIESTKVIVTNIADKIEKGTNVAMSTQSEYINKATKAFTGSPRNVRPVINKTPVANKPVDVSKFQAEYKEELKKDKAASEKIVNKTTTSTEISKPAKIQKQLDTEANEKAKKEIIDNIANLAVGSMNTNDALEKLGNDDYVKELIMKLAAEEDTGIKINQARIDRMAQLNNEFLKKEVKGKTIEDILDPKNDTMNEPLPSTSIKTDSPFADEWKDLKYINFDKTYDINQDIVKMLNALSTKQYPIAVRNIDVKDNSTSEDYIDTYTVEIEDFRGKRGTIKFDVPKFKNNKYLILRGNKKTIQNQYFNMPILKTEQDTVQIISNYNKIFIRRFGNTKGKSISYADQLVKALSKYTGRNIKVVFGDNSKLADYYDMPIDYIDLGSIIHSIEYKGANFEVTFYFNQKEFREKYKDLIDLSLGLPISVTKEKGKDYINYYNQNDINYTISQNIINVLANDAEFAKIINSVSRSKKYVYSQASIMSQKIPLIIVAAFSEGLLPVLKKANIQYELVEKLDNNTRHDYSKDWIQFSDGYLVYNVNYDSSMFMNGLKEVSTLDYSLEQVNEKRIWTEMLDNYGGRIIADGLENFYECMLDPITLEVLDHYKMPKDYVSLLVYANALLSDNSYIAHGDSSSRRIRRNELIAVKVYKALFNDAYATFATGIRHSRLNTVYTVKQSAVIDKFMTDTISSDLSVSNCLNDIETANSVSTKGESGMNSVRSYTLNKRIYDSSMLNLLGMSTGFAGTVGVTRQATINMNIDTTRGYIKSIDGDTSKMNTANTLTITEALSPMGSTHDDPMRVAMTFVQTSKHQVRTAKSDPLLVTSGADSVLPYLTTDIFCKKSEKAGTVTEVTDTYMTIAYNDGTNDYVDLSDRIEKNSDGGFFVGVKLDTDLKVGQKVTANQILAYDRKSFSNRAGESKLLTYDAGKLAKVAIINSDDNFEDSAMITTKMSEDMATDVILKEDRLLDCKTNIYNYLKKGAIVQQEDILYETQTAYEEEDVNLLLKNLAGDNEQISKLGRRPVKSPVTGKIVGIKVYRSCELEDMSPSLQKFFKEMEAESRTTLKKLKELGIDDPTITGSAKKLEPIGKLKNAPDSVLIEYYIEYHDIMAVGDKLTIFAANKGVVHSIIPSEVAPYSDFRPNEEISLYTGIATINKRQIASNLIVGSLNKLCIELGRSVRDILDIPFIENEIDI